MSMKNARKGQAAIERTPFASRSQSKGQAAMEYLMTYGWAILVIVIVLAVLLFLNPFKAPETCLFQQPGFSCSESLPQVYTKTDNGVTNTYIAMSLYNKLGQTVKVHQIVCTTAAIGDVTETTFSAKGWLASDPVNGDPISAGASKKFTGTEVECLNANGDPLSLGENAQFKGVISVWYNYENDPDPAIHRQASATLVSTVLKGS